MMDMNTISQAQSAQSAQAAQGAALGNAADAALFQNLIAAALLQKGGTVPQGTTARTLDLENASEAENADLGLLVKLLLGGGVFAAETPAKAETSALPKSLLAAMGEVSAGELLAAVGGPDIAAAAELLADTGAAPDARGAHIAADAETRTATRAADGAATEAARETRAMGTEAANAPPRERAEEPRARLTADAAQEDSPATGGTPERAKALRIETPPGDGTRRAAPDRAEAVSPPRADAAPYEPDLAAADGAAVTADESRGPFGGGAPGENDAARVLVRPAEAAPGASATSPQEGIAAAGPETDARPAAQEQAVSRAAPHSQIARELFAALAKGQVPASLSLRLEPAELGKIDVSMKLTAAGKLVIGIVAENAGTQALLAGQTDKLVQALGLQNVQVESVNTAAAPVQQPAQAYGDRSMAFFMDLAHGGGREERPERDGKEQTAQRGQAAAGIAAEEAAPETARYARRLDLTA
ncbi:MAG: flagellar hook-length control protein FliK [Clostridiales Family XIII bacterium]|jgi:flagellar hook-length control protein FliK|nr:flagellar hook-length control protein FliK [Clostridiales Family XIII bacterium]